MPVSAKKCGMEFNEYITLARNVNRIKALTSFQIKYLGKKALEELSDEGWTSVGSLMQDIPYFTEFFKLAEIPRHQGCCNINGTNVVLFGILDYFLRNKDSLNSCLYNNRKN